MKVKIFVSVMLFMLLASPVYASTLNSTGAASWHFSGSLSDSSGNSHTLATSTGAEYTNDQVGDSNAALDLTGGDYYDSSGTADTFTTNSFTYEMVFYVDSAQSSTEYFIMNDYSNSGLQVKADTDGTLIIYLRDNDGSLVFNNVDTNIDVSDDEWHYLAVSVQKNGRAVIWMDSDLIINNSNTDFDQWVLGTAGANFALGAKIDNSLQCAHCYISEVRFTEGVLNQSHVNLLYDVVMDYPNNFRIYAFDAVSNDSISNFGVVINGTGYNSTTGVLLTDYIHSDGLLVDITVNSTIYGNNTYTLYNTSNDLFAYMNISNAIKFNFYDQKSLWQITENVSVEIISNSASYSNVTETGNISFYMLIPENYTVRYSSENYVERFYYFELTDDFYDVVDLYLLNNSYAKNVTATVYNELNQLKENILINVLAYFVGTNDYKVVESQRTNFYGEAELSLTLNDEFYKFRLYYPDDTLVLATTSLYITSNDLTFFINEGGVILGGYQTSLGVTHNLSFDGVDTVSFDYQTTAGSVTQLCLIVNVVDALEENLQNSSCSSSPSGTLNIILNHVNGSTYNIQAIASIQGDLYLIDTLNLRFDETNPFQTNGKNWGVLICIVLTLLFGLAFAVNPVLGLIITPLPLVVLSAQGMLPINLSVAISIEAAALVAAFIVGRRS